MRQANSRDRTWLARERTILQQIEDDIYVTLLTLKHNQQASAIGAGANDGKVYKHHFEHASEHLRSISMSLLPFLSWDRREGFIRKLEDARKDYEQVFGSLNDPKTQKDIEDLRRHFLSENQKDHRNMRQPGRADERQALMTEVHESLRQSWRDRRSGGRVTL